MRVLFVSAEVAPYAKVGGLADVAGSLPKALRDQGHDVRVVMPDYRMISVAKKWKITTIGKTFDVPINSRWTKQATLRTIDGVYTPTYLLGTDAWFGEVDRSEAIYRPGIDQYLFFSVAVLEMLGQLDWTPDVIHCHDWHTGFIPVLLRERYAERYSGVAAVYTIHNLAYQGLFDAGILDSLDLPRSLFSPSHTEAWGYVNFLKSGCTYSDQVNTVSPNYAEEILTPMYGATLDGLMRHLKSMGRLHGILNGIDPTIFDPSTDPELPTHYSAADPAGKAACREALLKEVGMKPIPGAPLFGVVSRMSSQKGMDLVVEAMHRLADVPIQIVILGAGEPAIVAELHSLQKQHPQHLRYIEGFNLGLGARIYGGCDGFLMPSAFEPCGLGQMIAMRYGTVPLVRATGGLKDTVTDGSDGFVFENSSVEDLLGAVARFVERFHSKTSWSQIVKRAMSVDFGWSASAAKYEQLYEVAVKARRESRLTQSA